ncbi:MAG: hypothetical protein ACLTY5_05955 [Angelakisella sp.]
MEAGTCLQGLSRGRGEKLREKYHIESDREPLAEAWVLSCHPDGMSRLAEGEMKGLTLPEAALKYPGNFFRTRCANLRSSRCW